MIHELKCLPDPFDAAWDERKTFEFRKNDRNFKVNDIVILREYHPLNGYTGRRLTRSVTYILKDGFGLPEGFCIFSMRPLSHEEEAYHAAGVKAA